MATRKRRIRSPHPGVKLKRRVRASGTVSWRGVYFDPGKKCEVYETLDPLVFGSREARTAWAKAKAVALARQRADLAAGAVKPWALEVAINDYLDTARATLKPKTIQGHELAIAKLREWAKRAGVQTTAELTPAALAQLRDFLIRAPRRGVKKGGRRGKRVTTAERRSPRTINRELQSLKALLNTCRPKGILPHLHRDNIGDMLKALPIPHEEPCFLSPADLGDLLEAAMRHDADCFTATREEHARGIKQGTTLRHVPIAPFVAFVLLTGMRRSEALATPWSAVDLDALDHEGRKIGEIRLPAGITKTNRARTIGLEVSPALRKLLAAMKLRSGGVGGHVFGGADPYTGDLIEAARRRLQSRYGAPTFNWQLLRSTCATYLTNAPGIFGGATVFLSAKQLGHGVAVAERHYLGVHRGIPRDARTLEAAMQLEGELTQVLTATATAAAPAPAPAKEVGRG